MTHNNIFIAAQHIFDMQTILCVQYTDTLRIPHHADPHVWDESEIKVRPKWISWKYTFHKVKSKDYLLFVQVCYKQTHTTQLASNLRYVDYSSCAVHKYLCLMDIFVQTNYTPLWLHPRSAFAVCLQILLKLCPKFATKILQIIMTCMLPQTRWQSSATMKTSTYSDRQVKHILTTNPLVAFGCLSDIGNLGHFLAHPILVVCVCMCVFRTQASHEQSCKPCIALFWLFAYDAIFIVIWDGALWFWSVIKTIMTDWLPYSGLRRASWCRFSCRYNAWSWQARAWGLANTCWGATCTWSGEHCHWDSPCCTCILFSNR